MISSSSVISSHPAVLIIFVLMVGKIRNVKMRRLLKRIELQSSRPFFLANLEPRMSPPMISSALTVM